MPVAPAPTFNLLWLLWATLAAVPWLLPTRTEPWTTFWADALAAGIWLLLAVHLLKVTGDDSKTPARALQRVAIDGLPLVALLLMLVAALQAVLGQLTFGNEALLPASYLAGFATAVILGRHCRAAAGEVFTGCLWTSLIIAAVCSAGIGLAQWLKVEPVDWLTPPAAADGRAIANVGQANHLATLIVWGLIGVWRARLRGQLGAAATAFTVGYLLFGLALTQSRTPWVEALVVGAIALRGSEALGGRRMLWALGAAVLAYAAGWMAMAHASDALALTPTRPAAYDASAGVRLTTWTIAIEAIADRPWLGWGWNQFWVAWSQLAPGRLVAERSPNGYAHNLFLDLLLWNGVVVGGLVVSFLLSWLWRMMRAAQSTEQWLLLCGIGAFGVHAMLELPHAYLLMLLPAAGMMGALSACTPAAAPLFHVHRGWVALAAVGLGALLFAITDDYRTVEARQQSQRIRDVGILARQPQPPMNLLVMRWLAEVNKTLEPRPASSFTPEDAARLRATLARYPSAGGLARYSQAAALHGDVQGAAWGLRTLCGLHERTVCDAALLEWQRFAAQTPAALPVPLPSQARK